MAAIETGGRNVLADLDQRVPTSFYWSLTLLATIGGFLFGYDTANIGSARPLVPYRLNGFAQGYLVASASLGAAAGALLAGPLADRLGRESLLITDALIYAVGAVLSAVAPRRRWLTWSSPRARWRPPTGVASTSAAEPGHGASSGR